MGGLGFDFVMFDSEHGPFTISDIEELGRACDAVGLTPMARVPNIHNSTILRFLDRGIMGIMGPHINTRKSRRRPSRTPVGTCPTAIAASAPGAAAISGSLSPGPTT